MLAHDVRMMTNWMSVRLWSVRGCLVLFAWANGCIDLEGERVARELEGRRFSLESAQGFQLQPDTALSLSFHDGEVSFSASCNSHFGEFELEDGRLVVHSLGSTEIGCGPALHAQDEWLASFITSRPTLVLDGDRLTLRGVEATLFLLDREVADPDRPLAGTPWRVDTFIENDAVSDLPLDPKPTLVFGQDGALQIDTTCNTGHGTYTVQGDRLALTMFAYTEAACSGASGYADARMRAVLSEGSVTFKIEAARLTLERGEIGLSATAR